MAQFKAKEDKLFIDGKEVIKAWESYTGWYWFATEKADTQDSVIDGQVYEGDTIWYGLVQGFEEEWGLFSQAEIERLSPKTWRIKTIDLPYSGRRS